jgi:hypothetical protein
MAPDHPGNAMADQIGGHGGGHGCRIGAKTGMNPVGWGDRNYPPYPIGAPWVVAQVSRGVLH